MSGQNQYLCREVADDACGDVELSEARELNGGIGRTGFRNTPINQPLKPRRVIDRRLQEAGLPPQERPSEYEPTA